MSPKVLEKVAVALDVVGVRADLTLRYEHHVHGKGKLCLMAAEDLAQPAFDPGPHDGVSHASCDHQTEARKLSSRAPVVDAQERGSNAVPTFEHLLKLPPPTNALRRTQCLGSRLHLDNRKGSAFRGQFLCKLNLQ